jgi:hypothetical protein
MRGTSKAIGPRTRISETCPSYLRARWPRDAVPSRMFGISYQARACLASPQHLAAQAAPALAVKNYSTPLTLRSTIA